MKLHKTYKYKLKLTKTQEKRCDSWIDICRYIYNVALEERITTYQKTKKSISKYEQYNQLPQIKKEFPWVADVYSHTLQETLGRVDLAYLNFFRGGGFPKFAKKSFFKSFTFKDNVKIISKNEIHLPKMGKVKYINSREIKGTVKTATIIKERKGYFINIVFEHNQSESTFEKQEVGIDVGISKFAFLSNGESIDNPLFFEKSIKKIRVLQRKLSRQKRGSNSRNKTIKKIQLLYLKISNQRRDFLHKESTKIANRFTNCYIEDLKLQSMNKINSTLSRKMSDSGFGMFKIFLQYKFKERGNNLILVNPAYTSQTCSQCLSVDKKSRISQSEFVCTSCGHIENADENASKNILRVGAQLGKHNVDQ